MPLAMIFLWIWLKRRYQWLDRAQRQMDSAGRDHLSSLQRVGLFLACVFCFLFAELFWRMMFEFMIAYFHIAIDLQKLAR